MTLGYSLLGQVENILELLHINEQNNLAHMHDSNFF